MKRAARLSRRAAATHTTKDKESTLPANVKLAGIGKIRK
jgi:hypothetical protein